MSEIPRFDCKCGHTAMEHFATSTTPEDGPMKPTWCITCGRDKCAQYEHAGVPQIETRHPLLIRAENAEQASADHLKELEGLRAENERMDIALQIAAKDCLNYEGTYGEARKRMQLTREWKKLAATEFAARMATKEGK